MSGDNEPTATVRASLALSFAERYLGAVLQLLATTILARLLTPRDYGVYTIAVAVIGLTSVLRDFGAVTFLFQERNLSSHEVQTIHAICLSITGGIALLMVASGGWVARFYHVPGIRDVLWVLSLTLLLTPYTSIVMTLLRRDMNFRALLLIEVSGAVMNAVVAIGFAVIVGGYMSLAWGAFAGAVSTNLMATIMRPRRYSLRPSFHAWRRIMPFGALTMAGLLVREIGALSPELIAGRLLGMDAVGILTRADGLIAAFERFIRGAVTPVAIASFAAQHRRGDSLKENFHYATQIWTGVAWPFFAVLCLLAAPAIYILFGAGWETTIPILRLYCVAAGITALTTLNWNAYQAIGAVGNLLRMHLIIQPIKVVLVVIAARYSLFAMGFALIGSAAISLTVAYAHARRLLDTSLAMVVRDCTKSAGVTVCASIVPALVVVLFHIDAARFWVPLLIGGGGACAGWFLGLRMFHHALWPEFVLACKALHRKSRGDLLTES